MNEQNTNPELDSHEEDETPEFSEQDLKTAIATVEALDIFLPTKNLIIKCLKCVSTINSILNRKKMNIRRLRRLFGIKTEKKTLLIKGPKAPPISRRQRLLKMLTRKATVETPTKTMPAPNK
jgi:hypothetical protein